MDKQLVTLLLLLASTAGILAGGGVALPTTSPWMDPLLPPEERALLLLAEMTLAEKIAMAHGVGLSGTSYMGEVAANPRLGIPALRLQDGPAGVADGATGVTAFPAALALAASWDTGLMRQYAADIAAEERGKGAGVQLAPMLNLARVPQAGRNFESFGEDPFLAAAMARAGVSGIQSQGVIAAAKHFVGNEQETDRTMASSDVDERTLQEIYYPPFRAAVRAGAGAVMGSYNRVNGRHGCEMESLDSVLRGAWGFDGFVMTDWNADFSAVAAANDGLDLEMPGIDGDFSAALESAVNSGQVPLSRLDGMICRLLATMFRFGLFDTPSAGDLAADVTSPAHTTFARSAAAQGMVLLKNAGNALPLNPAAIASIAVIGSAAATAPISTGLGSGSVILPYEVTPLQGIINRAGAGVSVRFQQGDGGTIAQAAQLAQQCDVAVVFAGERAGEGNDRAGLSLPGDINELISAVALANSRTIVVLNTSGPVLMPWINRVPAVLAAWYPGQENGNAAAAVLFGDVNPAGRLPVTFPGSATEIPTGTPDQYPGIDGHVSYSENLRLGYRWYDANLKTPLFPFGHGLSYTTFTYYGLSIGTPTPAGQVEIAVTVRNSGGRLGGEVVQLYLGFPAGAGEPPRQLKGFRKVVIPAEETQRVSFPLTAEELACWDPATRGWQIFPGTYTVFVGSSSRDIRLSGAFTIVDSPASSHGANVALHRTAGASAADAGGEAALAVDGDLETSWISAAGGTQWLLADLGNCRDIGRVVLRWGAGYGRSYRLQTLSGGGDWQDLYVTASGDGGVDDLPGLAGRGRLIRLLATEAGVSGGYSLREFEIFPPAQAPFGPIRSLPGRIQAEDFDTGGEGVAFHDSDDSVPSGGYRDDGVDLDVTGDSGGGYDIDWDAAGEWLEYTVDVPDAAAAYSVSLRVACPGDGRKLWLRLDGAVLAVFPVPNTGGAQNWQTVTLPRVPVTGGPARVLRLESPEGGFRLNWLEFNRLQTCDTANAALGGAVSVSSSEPAFGGAMAVDGSLLTRWQSVPGNTAPWICVDLGSAQTIGRIKLDWAGAYARSYVIRISPDGSGWTEIYRTTAGDGGIDDLAVTGQGRYVRLSTLPEGPSPAYSLWEMEVFGAVDAALIGDLDGDGDVDPDDLAILCGFLAGNANDIPAGPAAADLDGDGTVGASDLAAWLSLSSL